MTRLPHIEPGTADASTEELSATARRQIGGTPNMTHATANSPALLNGYLALSAALSRAACARRARTDRRAGGNAARSCDARRIGIAL
ncbi:MAG TPA: hypothetical protein VFV73_33855 [Streptosporangiaceae bacterium]|nr:hypothetical protein [Streptosporangiaceae bacterium]